MRSSIAIFLLLTVQSTFGQMLFPAKWTIESSKSNAKVGEEIDLTFNVKLDPTWFLYSTDFDPDLGPIVTTFSFEKNDTFQLIGEIKPVGAKKKYDETWDGEYTYFKEKARFVQRVKILKVNPKIEGIYEYQVCTELDGRCINFDDSFDFSKMLNN